MAKGQQRGNREAKKPKKEKPKVAATAQASFGLTPLKSTGAMDDQGKKNRHQPDDQISKLRLPLLDEHWRRACRVQAGTGRV
jgi:hypothetical protein